MNARALIGFLAVCAVSIPGGLLAGDAGPAPAPAPATAPAAAPQAKALKTLEEQVSALEDALADAMHAHDWKMVELAATGFKAAALPSRDLEMSLLRAERNAAWKGSQQARLEPWGLAARASCGDTSALERLRKMAYIVPAVVPPPDYRKMETEPAAVQTAQAEHQKYNLACSQKSEALLCLALLKEPGISEKLRTSIEARAVGDKNALPNSLMGYGTDPVTIGALIADKDAAVQYILEACENAKGTTVAQTALLNGLNALTYGQAKDPNEAFSVEQEAGAMLPKDFGVKTAKTVSILLARHVATEMKGYDNTVNSLVTLAQNLPANSMTAEGTKALQSMRDKLDPNMIQYLKPMIDKALKNQGVDPSTAAKPPAPPKGDF
jgi:hypothetical protein